MLASHPMWSNLNRVEIRNKDTVRDSSAIASLPEAIVCITVSLLFLLPSTLRKYLPFVHLCDLPCHPHH
jgi:hypothetical protein